MPGMRAYRCDLLDARHHIAAVEVVECFDDDEAKLRAREILAVKPGHRAVEVWDRARCVYVHASSDDAPADAQLITAPQSTGS